MLGSSWRIENEGHAGHTTQQRIDAFATDVEPFFVTGAQLIFFEWRNSLAGGTTIADEKVKIADYCTQAQTAGFFVWLATAPPTADGVSSGVDEINTWVRENWESMADGLIDFAAIPELTPAGVTLNPTYYSDATHLTDAGYALMATVAQTALLGT